MPVCMPQSSDVLKLDIRAFQAQKDPYKSLEKLNFEL